MKHEIMFVIPYEVISLNRWQRLHYRARKRHMQDIDKSITVGILDPALCPVEWDFFRDAIPLKKCRVTIEVRRRRFLDPDNICVKALIDRMKKLGWFVDDSKKYITLYVHEKKKGKNEIPHVTVFIEWNDARNPRKTP